MTLHELPNEIFDIITKYLDARDKIALTYVVGTRSVQYNDVINDIKYLPPYAIDLQNMRKVKFMFCDTAFSSGIYNEYLVSTYDTKKLIISIIRLHHTPHDPNDKIRGIKIKFLSIDEPTYDQYISHWWTSPDLSNPNNGAKILGLRYWKERIIYASANYNEEQSKSMADYDDNNDVSYSVYVDPEYIEYIDTSDE